MKNSEEHREIDKEGQKERKRKGTKECGRENLILNKLYLQRRRIKQNIERKKERKSERELSHPSGQDELTLSEWVHFI